MRTLEELKTLIACGKGEIPCDYKLENVNLVNVFSAEIYPTDIYIKDKRIVSIQPQIDLKALHTVDCKGMYAMPGFIDSHMHFESTMLSPEALAQEVIPKGTTTLMADLMEIANVAGKAGLEEMLVSIRALPYRMLLEISSRVPTAPGLETSGAVLGAEEVAELLAWEESRSLGEMDSSKILLSREDQYLEKILSALNQGLVVNGHAIGRLGQELNIFASSGISDDHECVVYEELLGRLQTGMKVFIREGSSERNVEELIKGVLEHGLETENLMFCTDDKHISDIRKEGHINYNVNKAIALGMEPMKAIQMATINAAKHFRMEEEIGSLTPGRLADIILSKSVDEIIPVQVWFEGQLVAENDKLVQAVPVRDYPEWIRDTVHLKRELSCQDFEIPCHLEQAKVRVIELIKDQIINKEVFVNMSTIEGQLRPDVDRDLLKIAIVERYGINGDVGKGFVRGFGLKEGAIAYSMSHDHHNIVVIGTNDQDMLSCVNHLVSIHGGACASKNGKVLADLQLTIGGLMSEHSADEVNRELENMNDVIKDLGCPLAAPLMTQSFISLPTVPELGLTDKGLIDVIHHKIVPLFE